MRRTLIGAAVVFLLGAASAAEAQVWDSPSFMGPRPGSDLGFYLVDGDGVDLGFQGVYRTDAGMNLGLRAGYLDTPGDGVLILGVETWGNIILEDTDFPLDLTWTAGAGAFLNGGTGLSVPVGVSFGRTLDLESLSIQLYGHPRLGLVFTDVGNDNVDLEGQFDIGADFHLSPDFTLRVGATFADFDAVGIGLALRQ